MSKQCTITRSLDVCLTNYSAIKRTKNLLKQKERGWGMNPGTYYIL